MKKELKMDKCREEFELYMLQSGYTECALSKSNHYDCYHDITIDAMYSAWKAGLKASRESMKAIKLPKHSNPLKHKTMMFISEVKILLESAGINVEIDE